MPQHDPNHPHRFPEMTTDTIYDPDGNPVEMSHQNALDSIMHRGFSKNPPKPKSE
jgi:hypothetical protein